MPVHPSDINANVETDRQRRPEEPHRISCLKVMKAEADVMPSRTAVAIAILEVDVVHMVTWLS